MKRILFVFSILILTNLVAFAEITPEEAASPEYTLNHGNSPEMVRLMELQKAQINGTKYVNNKGKLESNKYFNPVRKLFIYLDPALDNGTFMQDKIKYSPSPSDL